MLKMSENIYNTEKLTHDLAALMSPDIGRNQFSQCLCFFFCHVFSHLEI